MSIEAYGGLTDGELTTALRHAVTVGPPPAQSKPIYWSLFYRSRAESSMQVRISKDRIESMPGSSCDIFLALREAEIDRSHEGAPFKGFGSAGNEDFERALFAAWRLAGFEIVEEA